MYVHSMYDPLLLLSLSLSISNLLQISRKEHPGGKKDPLNISCDVVYGRRHISSYQALTFRAFLKINRGHVCTTNPTCSSIRVFY